MPTERAPLHVDGRTRGSASTRLRPTRQRMRVVTLFRRARLSFGRATIAPAAQSLRERSSLARSGAQPAHGPVAISAARSKSGMEAGTVGAMHRSEASRSLGGTASRRLRPWIAPWIALSLWSACSGTRTAEPGPRVADQESAAADHASSAVARRLRARRGVAGRRLGRRHRASRAGPGSRRAGAWVEL